MENNLINKVYDFFNHIIHPNDLKPVSLSIKRCPVTGLDISMQAKHTKFLSVSGIKWYYRYERELYYQFLSVRLSPRSLNKDLTTQFKLIAHSIRNAESNPRNNTRRAIKKLLNDKNSLFNNLQLIDKNKLQEAGLKNH
ncbi:MAG: hypothetical protein C0597_09560 [Marinilabiliales bacterium]|nr:MAG: hypothetical protein C0597_09560 [Marinilabiliales bacterium]